MTTTHDIGTPGPSADAGTTEQAKQAASTAADQAQQVAGTAQEEIGKVAGEARAQTQDLLGEARGHASDLVGEQANVQRDRLVSTLSGLSSDLRAMVDGADGQGGSGLAGTVAREVADRAQALEQHLDGRDPGALLDDVRRFARQRPGLFLAGALVAGIAAGRLARGAQAAQGTTGAGTTGAGTSTGGDQPLGTAEGAPVPTVPPPAMGDSPLVSRAEPVPPTAGTLGDPLAGGRE